MFVKNIVKGTVLALALIGTANAQSVQFQAPAPGSNHMPGDSITVTVFGSGATIGWDTVAFSAPSFFEEHPFPLSSIDENFTVNFTYVPPLSTAGQTIALDVLAIDKLAQVRTATININIGIPDDEAPTYPGAVGAVSAERVGFTGMNLVWNAATDNVTAAGDIVYNIYWDEVEANVFTAGIKTTRTGMTTTNIGGFDAGTVYHVGVRAEDEMGNAETNTVTVELGVPTSVDASTWMMYE